MEQRSPKPPHIRHSYSNSLAKAQSVWIENLEKDSILLNHVSIQDKQLLVNANQSNFVFEDWPHDFTCQSNQFNSNQTDSKTPSHLEPSPIPVNDCPDYTVLLPDEVLLFVLSLLKNRQDRSNASFVSKRWFHLEARLRHKLQLSVSTWLPVPHYQTEPGCMDRVLARMLPRLINLTEIRIDNIVIPEGYMLTDDGFSLIGKWCKGLKIIQIKVSSISGKGIRDLVKGCGSSLEKVDLYQCSHVDSDSLTAIANHCQKLTFLSLRSCRGVDDDALCKLSNGILGQVLEGLILEFCSRVGDYGLESISKGLVRLRYLDISRCDVTDVGLSWVASHCKNLQVLFIRGCSDLTNVGLRAVAMNCCLLKQLDLRRIRGSINPSGLTAMILGCELLEKIWCDDSLSNAENELLALQKGVELIVSRRVIDLPNFLF